MSLKFDKRLLQFSLISMLSAKVIDMVLDSQKMKVPSKELLVPVLAAGVAKYASDKNLRSLDADPVPFWAIVLVSAYVGMAKL